MKKLVLLLAVLPVPIWPAQSKLPTPVWTEETVVVADRPIDLTAQRDANGRLVRLPGPTNYYHCPQCGSSSDLMYLGQHLRGPEHRKTVAEIERIGWRNLNVWHDNLHNVGWKPVAQTKVTVRSTCTTCEGGTCNVGPIRRIFGWR